MGYNTVKTKLIVGNEVTLAGVYNWARLRVQIVDI